MAADRNGGKMQELPKNKVLSSLKDIDRRVVPLPMVVIYKNPTDFPKGCVARVFDAKTGRPTSLCILRKTVQECREDVEKSGFRVKFPRAAVNDKCIVESWV